MSGCARDIKRHMAAGARRGAGGRQAPPSHPIHGLHTIKPLPPPATRAHTYLFPGDLALLLEATLCSVAGVRQGGLGRLDALATTTHGCLVLCVE